VKQPLGEKKTENKKLAKPSKPTKSKQEEPKKVSKAWLEVLVNKGIVRFKI
jgi:hypothetical protein